MKRAPLVVSILAFLAGCGGPQASKPVSTSRATDATMERRPMTVDQRVEAIQRSSAPEDKKREAIARLRSGRP